MAYVRVVSGKMEAGQAIKLMRNDARYEVKEVGVSRRRCIRSDSLNAGDVGYFIANIKSDRRNQNRRHRYGPAKSGARAAAWLPGNSSDGVQRDLSDQHRRLRASENRDRQTAAERFGFCLSRRKVRLRSGFGFRCGFLGLLHMEIIQERLRREYDMDIIATYPERHLRSATRRAARRC